MAYFLVWLSAITSVWTYYLTTRVVSAITWRTPSVSATLIGNRSSTPVNGVFLGDGCCCWTSARSGLPQGYIETRCGYGETPFSLGKPSVSEGLAGGFRGLPIRSLTKMLRDLLIDEKPRTSDLLIKSAKWNPSFGPHRAHRHIHTSTHTHTLGVVLKL